MRKGKSDKWLLLIGSLKLVKGLLLLLLAAGALKLIHRNVAGFLEHWIRQLNVDENSRLVQKLFEKIDGLNERKLSLLGAGTFFYSALFLTEGTGLLLRKRWAEYFTVIVTGSFLPLEVYELVREFNALKLALLIVNAAIVVYLIWRLKHSRKNHH